MKLDSSAVAEAFYDLSLTRAHSILLPHLATNKIVNDSCTHECPQHRKCIFYYVLSVYYWNIIRKPHSIPLHLMNIVQYVVQVRDLN